MNQERNIALYVSLIIVGVILVSGLGVGVRYYTQKRENQTPESKQIQLIQLTQPPKIEGIKPVAEDWKIYKNDELGFEFGYPLEFGDVVVQNGNTTSVKIPPCEGPMMKTYGSKEYLGVYNVSIKFPKAPIIIEIRFLDLNTPNLPKEVCDNVVGGSVTLSSIQPVPQGVEIMVTNKAGIKFVFNPLLSSSIGTELSGPEYKTRYNNKLVWLSSGYIPYFSDMSEEIELELREYSCDNTEKYGKDPLYGECGIIRWAKDGKTSEKIRTAFNILNQIVDSFKFTTK